MHSKTTVWRRLPHALVLSLLAAAGAFTSRAATQFQVQETTLGPVDGDAKYVFSAQGAHAAIVARKGSRLSVIVDGVAGPRVENVLTPSAGFIDAKRANALGDRYGTLGVNLRPALPVTFSNDGQHFAYLAKMGDDWVLFRDGKEVRRMPAGAAPDAFRLEFADDGGKHLMFIYGTTSGDEFWVDGQRWPGYVHDSASGNFGPVDPVVSPDGGHIACTATIDGKDVTELDGKPTGYNGENLQFTADSRHLICLVHTPAGAAVFADGKPLFSARELLAFYVAPVGLRVAAIVTHFSPQTHAREGVFLLVDGKPVEATLGDEIKSVVFSPDGKHYAAICGKAGTRFIVSDGTKGEDYQEIDADSPPIQGPTFSPDSSKLVYLAHAAGRTFVVVNTDESDALSDWPQFFISPDSQHVAIAGSRDNQQVLVMDGQVVAHDPHVGFAPVVFSPDSRRYIAGNGLVIDGKVMTGSPLGPSVFSPDSRHYAIASNVVYVDGHPLGKYGWNGIGRAFSPDGRHLCWITREPATNPDAAPNSYEEVIYIDDAPALHLDDFVNGPMNVRAFYTSKIPGQPWLLPHEWSFGADGSFTCVGPAGGQLKRFTIALGAQTSLEGAGRTSDAASTAAGAVASQRAMASSSPAAQVPPPSGAAGMAGQPGQQPGAPAKASPLAALASLFGRNRPVPATAPAPAASANAKVQQAKQKVDDAAKKASAWLDALSK